MADPVPSGLVRNRQPFTTPDVDVRHWFWQRLRDYQESEAQMSSTVWIEMLHLLLHILSLIEVGWRPYLNCAFQEDWGEPFLPAPLRHRLTFPTEHDAR